MPEAVLPHCHGAGKTSDQHVQKESTAVGINAMVGVHLQHAARDRIVKGEVRMGCLSVSRAAAHLNAVLFFAGHDIRPPMLQWPSPGL